LEALSRQLQEHRRDPTPADTGAPTAGRQTRKRPASQALQEALGIERESADEQEARRVEKSTKKARTTGGREELDKVLGNDRSSKQGKGKGNKGSKGKK